MTELSDRDKEMALAGAKAYILIKETVDMVKGAIEEAEAKVKPPVGPLIIGLRAAAREQGVDLSWLGEGTPFDFCGSAFTIERNHLFPAGSQKNVKRIQELGVAIGRIRSVIDKLMDAGANLN